MWELLAKLGAGIGSSILGGKLAKSKPSPLEQQQIDRANIAGERGQAISQDSLTRSKNLFDLGMPAMQQPVNYWSSLLTGDRSKMTSAMGPELSRIGEGYRAAGETSAALNPRGGPTPDFLSQQPYNQQRDVSTLFQQARPDAAKQLSGAGSNIMANGSTLLANAIASLYNSTAAGHTILDFEAKRRAIDRTSGEKLGTGLYDILFPAKGGGLMDIFKKG